MYAAGPKNPLHGITLEKMVTDLQEYYGWEMLGRIIKINCFNWQPSVKSSLVFLRKTPWARQKVEELYVDALPDLKSGKPFEHRDGEDPQSGPPIGDDEVALAIDVIPETAPEAPPAAAEVESPESPSKPASDVL